MATAIVDITRKRGDTRRMVFTIKDHDTKLPIDISAWTAFLMTVDPVKKPLDNAANIGQMTGTLLTDGSDGKVYFVPPGTWDVGKFYHDAQAVDSNSEKTTFVEGKYVLEQDITKD